MWILFSNVPLVPLCGLSAAVRERAPGTYNWLAMDLGVVFASVIRTDRRQSGCFPASSSPRDAVSIADSRSVRAAAAAAASVAGGLLAGKRDAAGDETCQVSCSLKASAAVKTVKILPPPLPPPSSSPTLRLPPPFFPSSFSFCP